MVLTYVWDAFAYIVLKICSVLAWIGSKIDMVFSWLISKIVIGSIYALEAVNASLKWIIPKITMVI